MPFIVTVWPECLGCASPSTDPHHVAPPTSRRAVATLEDACGPFARPPGEHEESMRARVDRATTYDYLRLWTPGTPPLRLPGGTLIEVEAMLGIVLAKLAGLTGRAALACSIAQDWAPAVDAFNARQPE